MTCRDGAGNVTPDAAVRSAEDVAFQLCRDAGNPVRLTRFSAAQEQSARRAARYCMSSSRRDSLAGRIRGFPGGLPLLEAGHFGDQRQHQSNQRNDAHHGVSQRVGLV